MSRRNELINQIVQLKAEVCDWPRSFSAEKKARFNEFNRQTLEACEALLQRNFPDETATQTEIRAFLTARWNEEGFSNSSMDYTHNPNLPSNKACLLLAKEIAREDEAVCQIVMPTITHIIGSVIDDVKFGSEDISGDFIPHNFMITEDRCALMAIPDIYHYARTAPERLFSPEKAIFHLTNEDRLKLRLIADGKDNHEKHSSKYHNTLQALYRIAHQQSTSASNFFSEALKLGWRQAEILPQNSLAFALFQFINAAKSQLTMQRGSECVFERERDLPVRQLFQYWKSLSEEQKEMANHHDGPASLKACLLTLFVHTPNLPDCTESEYETISAQYTGLNEHQRPFPSLDIIANTLFDILVHNTQKLSEIRLGLLPSEQDMTPEELYRSRQAQVQPQQLAMTEEDLDRLQCNLEEALKIRAPIQGNREADSRLEMLLLDTDANASPTKIAGFARLFQAASQRTPADIFRAQQNPEVVVCLTV